MNKIETEDEYNKALERLSILMNSNNPEDEKELKELVGVIVEYELSLPGFLL